MSDVSEQIRFQVLMPAYLYARLKELAIEEDRSKGSVVRRALEERLARAEGKPS